MKQYYTAIFVGFFFLLMVKPVVVLAWFVDPQPVTQPFEDPSLGEPSDVAELYLYDTIFSAHSHEKGVFLRPSTKFFVAVDKIDLDFPVQTLTERALSASDSLDALLNANLALRQLLEQYAALQDRAIKLLNVLNVPYLEQLKARDGGHADAGLSGSKDSGVLARAHSIASIRVQKKRLTRQILKTIGKQSAGIYYLSGKTIPSFSGLQTVSEAEMGSGKKVFTLVEAAHVQNGENAYKTGSVDQIALSGKKGGAVGSGRDGGHGGKGEYAYGGQRGGALGRVSEIVGDASRDSQLPWMFKMVLSGAGYVAANKVESLFYAAMAVLITYFILLKAKA